MKQFSKEIYNELLFTFGSIATKENLKKIAVRYNFLNKLEVFYNLTEEVLFGKTKVQDLEKNLRRVLGVSDDIAQYIGIELDQDLFSNVRDEFNVAQGLMTPIEYNEKHGIQALIEQLEEEEVAEEEMEAFANTTAVAPQKENTNILQQDPVAANILGENRELGSRSDPYREPIE